MSAVHPNPHPPEAPPAPPNKRRTGTRLTCASPDARAPAGLACSTGTGQPSAARALPPLLLAKARSSSAAETAERANPSNAAPRPRVRGKGGREPGVGGAKISPTLQNLSKMCRQGRRLGRCTGCWARPTPRGPTCLPIRTPRTRSRVQAPHPAQPSGPEEVPTRLRPLSPQPACRGLHREALGVHPPDPHALGASPPPAPARRATHAARDGHRMDPTRGAWAGRSGPAAPGGTPGSPGPTRPDPIAAGGGPLRAPGGGGAGGRVPAGQRQGERAARRAVGGE